MPSDIVYRGACRRTQAAFTLIELLVVIAIIGVLAGLVMPTLGKGRAKGQSARCVSNLRQWGLALQMYADDHDGFIPRRGQGVNPVAIINRPEDWFNCLPRYFNSRPYCNLVAQGIKPRAGDGSSIFIDPSAKDPGGTYFLPYAMNMYLSPWIRPQQHKLSEVPNPGQLAFMADALGPYASTVPSVLGYSVQARHGGRANIVFVDGRVQSFAGGYLGCGAGAIEEPDVRWQTLTAGINQLPVP
jgi:prepilin-type N-terminal cleavage/methylation domain-containing protein/prepilin-type processing-associated H-X9-DG protein